MRAGVTHAALERRLASERLLLLLLLQLTLLVEWRLLVLQVRGHAVRLLLVAAATTTTAHLMHSVALLHRWIVPMLLVTLLLVATAESFQARRAVEVARARNPQIAILARTHSADEQSALGELGADQAVFGERALARELLRLTLQRLGLGDEEISRWSA